MNIEHYSQRWEGEWVSASSPRGRRLWHHEPPRPKLFSASVRRLGLLLPILLLAWAALVPNMQRSRPQSQYTACKSNLKNIGIALAMYSTDHGAECPPSLEALTPNYLRSLPECPALADVSYRLTPAQGQPGDPDYLVECVGGNHSAVGVTGDYPAWHSEHGILERSSPAESTQP